MLLDNNANTSTKNKKGQTALDVAIERTNDTSIKEADRQSYAKIVDMLEFYGGAETLEEKFFGAFINGKVSLMKQCIKKGVNLDAKNLATGLTISQIAFSAGLIEIPNSEKSE